MTRMAARLVGTLLLVGGFAAVWHFWGFRPAVGFWAVWYTQSHLYHVVWSQAEDGD